LQGWPREDANGREKALSWRKQGYQGRVSPVLGADERPFKVQPILHSEGQVHGPCGAGHVGTRIQFKAVVRNMASGSLKS
jgi:hypothetical protein